MDDSVRIESKCCKVSWLRPNGDAVSMSLDEFHQMYTLSAAARFRVKYPNLTTVVRRMTEDHAALLLVEVFGMDHEEAVSLFLDLV